MSMMLETPSDLDSFLYLLERPVDTVEYTIANLPNETREPLRMALQTALCLDVEDWGFELGDSVTIEFAPPRSCDLPCCR